MLTPEQRIAVAFDDSHSCLIAVPGAGKTMVVAHKIAKILRAGRQVHGLSFTRAAARELRERALKLAGPELSRRCTVSTFHAGVRQGVSNWSDSPQHRLRILREADAEQFKLMTLEDLGIEPTSQSLEWFESCRLRVTDPYGLEEFALLPASDSARQMRQLEAEQMQDALKLYTKILNANRCLDFIGVMRWALDEVCSGRRLFMADDILIDEAQDMDELQLMLVMAHGTWCRVDAVGDDDQSIYAFRHALGYFGLKRLVAELGAKELYLTTNFRSKTEILHWAAQVIAQNRARIPKELIAAQGPGGRTRLLHWTHGMQEMDAVAKLVRQALEDGHKSVAVMARTKRHLLQMQAALTGIVPFDSGESDDFWALTPCAVSLALLRCIDEPRHELAGLEEALYWFGASAHDIAHVRYAADGEPIARVLACMKNAPELSEAGRIAVGNLNSLLRDVGYPRVPRGKDVDFVLELVFETMIFIVDDRGDARSSTEASMLKGAEQALLSLPGSLRNRLRIVSDARQRAGNAAVKLLTIHSAKGTQCDAAFVICAADHIIPGDSESVAEVEEERRLLYVAMTRARHQLIITYALQYGYGRGVRHARLSRLLDLPDSIADEDALE